MRINKTSTARKLTLTKESLRQLRTEQLTLVQGGGGGKGGGGHQTAKGCTRGPACLG